MISTANSIPGSIVSRLPEPIRRPIDTFFLGKSLKVGYYAAVCDWEAEGFLGFGGDGKRRF
jgi:hypothetical protein